MIKSFLFILSGFPLFIAFNAFISITYLLTFGKINFDFWKKLFNRIRFSSKMLWMLFFLFVFVDLGIICASYLYYTRENNPNYFKNIHWNDINNKLIFKETNNNWNWNISSYPFSVVQQCLSERVHNSYFFYNNHVLAKTVGKIENNIYEYDIFVNGEKEITLRTTNGKPDIMDEKSFLSMIAFNPQGNITAYVKWSSFTFSNFNVKNINGKNIVNYEYNDGSWIITNLDYQNYFSPIYASIYLGQYIFSSKPKWENDGCNMSKEICVILLTVSIFLTIFFMIGTFIYAGFDYRKRYMYSRV